MSNTVQPSYEINYISQQKKVLVGRNNNTIYQKFKIDKRIQDSYYFQVVSKNNQIVDLSGFSYEFYGSYIDAKQNTHILFYSDQYTIEDNVLSFRVNTYNSQYINYIRVPKQIDITIKKKASGIQQVILRDIGLAYPCPEYQGEEPTEVVAGFGLNKNGYVLSLTGTVLSGDGQTIEINDNVISCIGGGGGATYTGGTDIQITSANVINFTGTIPSAVSELTNDTGFITNAALADYALTSDLTAYLTSSDLSEYATTGWVEGKGYITSSQIPTSYVQESDLAEYALTSQIPTSASQLINDVGYITSTAINNQQNMLIDDVRRYDDYVLGYNKDYDIFYNTSVELSPSGYLYITPVSGIESIEVGKTATFEHWIKPIGQMSGITLANGLMLVGQLPSSFTRGYTQVFTRRIIKSSLSSCIQQISYAYEFANKNPFNQIPLTFEAYNTYTELQVSVQEPIDLSYNRNNTGWVPITDQLTTIGLNPTDTVAFSGTNSSGLNGIGSNVVNFSTGGQDFASLKVYGNVMSLLTGDFENVKNFDFISSPTGVFYGLFENNRQLRDASNLILPATKLADNCYDAMFLNCSGLIIPPSILPATALASQCYRGMFENCTSLSTAPALPATTLTYMCYKGMFASCRSLTDAPYLPATELFGGCYDLMFDSCSNLSSIEVNFDVWGESGNSYPYGWVIGVAANGTFTKPAELNVIYGNDAIPSGWTVVNK